MYLGVNIYRLEAKSCKNPGAGSMKSNDDYEEEKEYETEEIIEENENYPPGRIRIFKIIISYCLLGILGWYSFNFLFHYDFFNIKYIIADGNDYLKQNEILKKSEIKIGENIFLLNLKKSVALLKGDPWIREVEIKKIIPDKIKIIIKERKVSAIVKVGDEYWESSKEGIILCLSDSKENTTGLPLITGLNSKNIKFGEKIPEPEYRTALEIIHCMEVILPKKFCGVDIIDSDDFLIYNQDGSIKVRVNKAEEIINKENLLRETLKKIMEEKLLIDYIDLRFKDSLVIKVKK